MTWSNTSKRGQTKKTKETETNIFLTGPPKSGKSSVLLKVIKELENEGYKIGGIKTPEIKRHGKRHGFYAMDVLTRKKTVLADMKPPGPTISKYRMHLIVCILSCAS